MVIAFFGHADFQSTNEYRKELLSLLEEEVQNEEVEFLLGGYGNFDSFARSCCAEYKKTHPQTRMAFVTPYITEEYQRNRLSQVKDLYDQIVYPELEKTPLRFAISKRNEWMAEKADLVIAYVACSRGGAYKALQFARRKKKTVINLFE